MLESQTKRKKEEKEREKQKEIQASDKEWYEGQREKGQVDDLSGQGGPFRSKHSQASKRNGKGEVVCTDGDTLNWWPGAFLGCSVSG